jgi:putative transposase
MWVTDPTTGKKFAKKSRRRFDGENTPHELTFSCYRGYKFLARDRVRRWFVESLDEARKKWPVDLWAWVIMPEHVHLIVTPRDSTTSALRIDSRVLIEKSPSCRRPPWHSTQRTFRMGTTL